MLLFVSSDPRPAPSHGHVCFVYDDPAKLAAHADGFLAAGIAAGERIWYVAPVRPRALAPSARFVSITTAYPGGRLIDPPAQVAEYAAATDRALAAGFTGLRVVAEATDLVRTPAQLAAFARYEHLADRLICTGAFTAMCAYDRRELGDPAIAELATMHAETNADVPFRLHACPPAQGSAALTGELDLAAEDLLIRALDRADLRPVGGEVVLHAAGLRFADHRALVRLDDYAARRAMTVVLRAAGAAIGRLAALLDLSRLRVETIR